jgi:DNA repair exonuclease SbcCD ATPase subunit
MVGKVADQRRAVEPVFTEIRDRQNQLERALLDLETDDRKNNLADRLKDIARDVSTLLGRVNGVQDTFATLNQYKEDLAKSHAELAPLRSSDAGINALIGELSLSHDRLAKSVDELETGGEAPLSARVETLSNNRNEIEQRLARIDDSANILNAIRLDFEELGQRQAQLERSLAGVETDPDGKTLVDRQNALNDFVLQSRQRLGALQETLATLNAFKAELSKSQADLVPLKAPVFGIEAMIADVSTTRDLLAKTVGEIEANGDVTLTSRVDALTKSKREVENRLARIFENFNALDALRKDIGGIFSTIRNGLNRIG